MKYSKEFLETNARLKTLDKEALNDELNKMTFDELLAHRDYMIREELGEENLIPEERRQEQIKKLQQMTREPSAAEVKPIRIHSHRTVKRIVALAAAIVVLISVFVVAAVASKRDFSILNGTVRFEDGKVYVRFSKNDDATMTLAELETDLREHGFEDVKIPSYFYEIGCKTKNVVYTEESLSYLVSFEIEYQKEDYSFSIISHLNPDYSNNKTMYGTENGETIQQGDLYVNLFDHGDGRLEVSYFLNNYEYTIRSMQSYEKMKAIAQTIK